MSKNVNVQRLSRFMSGVCTLIAVGLPIGVIVFWSNFEITAQKLAVATSGNLQMETIETWQLLSAGASHLIATLILVYGIWHLRHVFNNFKTGQLFTEQNARSMYVFCVILFVSVVLKIITTTLTSVLLTWNNGPGEKALILCFGSNELWTLFIAATFLAISWSFKEGLELARENAQFV